MKKVLKMLFFPVIGFLSLFWFLIRVIPKPSRATYPCMRATAPLASSFVIWLIGLSTSVLFFRKARKFLPFFVYFPPNGNIIHKTNKMKSVPAPALI